MLIWHADFVILTINAHNPGSLLALYRLSLGFESLDLLCQLRDAQVSTGQRLYAFGGQSVHTILIDSGSRYISIRQVSFLCCLKASADGLQSALQIIDFFVPTLHKGLALQYLCGEISEYRTSTYAALSHVQWFSSKLSRPLG